MFNQVHKVLILAPHPDDAEFGLGGTISKLIEEGKEIHIAVFSDCKESTPKGFEIGSIKKELYESCGFLGVPAENIHMMDFQVRHFPALRQEILESLVVLRNELKPDLVFVPSSSDIHQDHKTIYEEGIRAFKFGCLLGYEMPWNNFGFTSFVFVNLKPAHLQKKIDAINHYESQKNRTYSSPEFITSLAVIRGRQIQKEYAESFELIRFTNY
ncbi:MAG: LmbE family N-acetylglucosaminyl deacetylase [Flavobacteriales bacterium]|jgi:LmbE family N-acetylglucosaminyl deacetylase